MKIDLIISADDIKNDVIKDKTVIVIDMLRATSVITTAMANGCKKLIPVITIEEALKISEGHRSEYILAGERKALKIEGFDCSNSPLEFTKEVIKQKTIVMTTSNGTKAIKRCEGAKNIIIGAMINAAAVAKKIIDLDNDVVIVNAGTYGQFSMDDFICGGYIIDCVIRKCSSKVELSDIGTTAHYVYDNNKDIISFVKNATHYKRIMELKLYEDLEYCCRKDITNVVPEYVNGEII